MCSINGAYIFSKLDENIKFNKIIRFIDFFTEMLYRSIERGPDELGIITYNNNTIKETKVNIKNKKIDISYIRELVSSIAYPYRTLKWIIATCRAEPLTEQKFNRIIQPVVIDDKLVVAHNGLVSNDCELYKQEDLIDTERIARFLYDAFKGYRVIETEVLKQKLAKIKGSFAFLIGYMNSFVAITNYKPLYTAKFFNDSNIVFFSSLEEFMLDCNMNQSLNTKLDNFFYDKLNITQIPPYSGIILGPKDIVRRFDVPREQMNNKALIICSSGMDSTTVAAIYKNKGYDITLLHFDYGCKASKKEQESIKKIAQYFNCNLLIIDMKNVYINCNDNCSLLNNNIDISKESGSAEYAFEWVPARNLVMLSIALAIAEAKGFSLISAGLNLEESGSYPDNEYIFGKKFSEIIPYATNLNKNIKVEFPLANKMKKEIVKIGVENKAPFHLTWSCYEKFDKHCGKCAACFLRKQAFKEAGIEDPTEYLE